MKAMGSQDFATEVSKFPETIGEKEIYAAYKLNSPTHVFEESKCKKNCKNNPRCYVGKGPFTLKADLDFQFPSPKWATDPIPAL